jgi:L-cysteine desulfidase
MLDSVRFEGHRSESIKSQKGFKKGHSVPDRVDPSVQSFIALITHEQVTEELQKLFGSLRASFAFKRSAVQVESPGDGTGSIATPLFQYSLTVSQDNQDAATLVWSHRVDRIKDSKAVQSEAFNEVFDTYFDTLVFQSALPIDLEEIVDALEEQDEDRVQLSYDFALTECQIAIDGLPGRIVVNKRELLLENHAKTSPAKLIHTFASLQRLLISKDGSQPSFLGTLFPS